jgi:hypothetical protein
LIDENAFPLTDEGFEALCSFCLLDAQYSLISIALRDRRRRAFAQMDKDTILKSAKQICRYCGWRADAVDHIMPLARGGTNSHANLVSTCTRCNSIAGAHSFHSVETKRIWIRWMYLWNHEALAAMDQQGKDRPRRRSRPMWQAWIYGNLRRYEPIPADHFEVTGVEIDTTSTIQTDSAIRLRQYRSRAKPGSYHNLVAPNGSAKRLKRLIDRSGYTYSAENLRGMGSYLAQLIGRPNPWSRTHLLGVLRGYPGVHAGPELDSAIRAALAISEDGVRPVQATHRDQAVLVPSWLDVAGALIGTPARSCVSPGCVLSFIPNHPSRKYCYACRPAKLPS